MALPDEPLRWDTPGLTWDDPRLTWDSTLPATKTMSINPNLIDGTLSAADITAINAALTTLNQKLPFLKGATPTQRHDLLKAGPKSRDFVEQALALAATHPEILPANFAAAAFAADGALYTTFAPLASSIAQFNEMVQDTLLLLNSDLILQALMVYAYAKAANFDGGMDTTLASLGARYAKAAKATATTPTPTPTPTPAHA
jgi:hypothetical protein